MELALTYGVPSGVALEGGMARVRLAGARERAKLSFRGAVRDPIAFREALGALHDVVISDFRWKPPASRLEFDRWLARELDRRAAAERERLEASRRRFFEARFDEERGAWIPLDPVCTVHPDQVFFEGLSRDGSSYGRVGLDRGAWEEAGETVFGTTNVDFSSALYESLRRLRSIFRTEVALGAEGLTVATEGARHREKKIDVPDGWVRGFLQLGSAFLLEAVAVELLPVHVHDICRYLRLHKARTSPRALRFDLEPGRPPVVVVEPWEHRMVMHGGSHGATEPRVIRVWGRQRLVLIERVIPLARTFVVHLLGRGLPWFVTARSGPLDFTLGLSGWTRNDWTQTARFDALIARRGGKARATPRPLEWLEKNWRGTVEEIAQGARVSVAEVHASLVDAAARGLVVFDLLHGVYRYRPLLDPAVAVAVAARHPEEEKARELVARGAVVVTGRRREGDGTTTVRGRATEDAEHVYGPEVSLSDEGAVAKAACGCWWGKQKGVKEGLCAHQHGLLLVAED